MRQLIGRPALPVQESGLPSQCPSDSRPTPGHTSAGKVLELSLLHCKGGQPSVSTYSCSSDGGSLCAMSHRVTRLPEDIRLGDRDSHMIDLKQCPASLHICLNCSPHTLLYQRNCQCKRNEPTPCSEAIKSPSQLSYLGLMMCMRAQCIRTLAAQPSFERVHTEPYKHQSLQTCWCHSPAMERENARSMGESSADGMPFANDNRSNTCIGQHHIVDIRSAPRYGQAESDELVMHASQSAVSVHST